MKRILSLSLIALILLNAIGYYFIFLGLEVRHTTRLHHQFDQDSIDPSKLMTLKIPISIPYSVDEAEFHRVDGKFVHEGEVFRLVKQRLSDDTLTIVCAKDHEGGKIQDALSNYLHTFSETNSDDQSTGKTSFFFMKDFIADSPALNSTINGWSLLAVPNSGETDLEPSYFPSIILPPERRG